MVQLFSEERYLRRDGTEVLGYDTIAPGSAVATSNPNLSGVQYPALIGAAFFTQKRERNGGIADIEFKPTDALTLDLSGFSSKLTASNFNRNYLLWPTHFLASGAGQAPLPGYTISQNTLTSATFAPVVQSRITARRCNATSSASLEATMQHRDAFSPRPTLPRS